MLTKLAIWYLRKRNKSVLIGFEINNADVKSLNRTTLFYDNRLNDTNLRTHDNYPLVIPEGKFNISRPDKWA